ncbi:MAG: ASPIC/UnbV domain-containing protein, partial [Anaerolineales bacterium]
NNNQTADLLRNDGGNRMNSLLVRTLGTKSNRDGVGARLRLTVGGKSQLREVKAGSSYLGENDLRVHFGLGSASRAERLEIRWPSGQVEVVENLDANQMVTVVEGKGITARQPFAREPKKR